MNGRLFNYLEVNKRMKMNKILLIGMCIFLILLVGCNNKLEEATDREQYCLDKNMTFDGTYVLQPNWTRCCKESTPSNDGTYRTNCEHYQFNQIKGNKQEEKLIFAENITIESPIWRMAAPTYYNSSERGYIQVELIKDNGMSDRFIVIECINSTLIIKDNLLYCEMID